MRFIKLTQKQIQQQMRELEDFLKNKRNLDACTFTYKPIEQDAPQPIIVDFAAMAWLKMFVLIGNTNTECAWHGIVEPSEDRTYFKITDILVYPQKLTGATVEDDDTNNAYEVWKQALDDYNYNHLRLQGHSHVNMTATPSGRDTATYDDHLQHLSENSYQIFMIANKKSDIWIEIYDLKNNVIYDKSDIDVLIEGEDLSSWYKDMKTKFFDKHKVSPKYSPNGVDNFEFFSKRAVHDTMGGSSVDSFFSSGDGPSEIEKTRREINYGYGKGKQGKK